MRKLGKSKRIYYFEEEGSQNIANCIELSVERAKMGDIDKIVIFTAHGEGPEKAIEMLGDGSPIKIIAVTYRAGKTFRTEEDGKEIDITPKISAKTRTKITKAGGMIVQGTMPFDEIITPWSSDPKIDGLMEGLRLLSGGTVLCIQAVLMACDAGCVEVGEEVITVSADTALIVSATNSETLFFPDRGLEIKEIICKPRNLTVSREPKYSRRASEKKEVSPPD